MPKGKKKRTKYRPLHLDAMPEAQQLPSKKYGSEKSDLPCTTGNEKITAESAHDVKDHNMELNTNVTVSSSNDGNAKTATKARPNTDVTTENKTIEPGTNSHQELGMENAEASYFLSNSKSEESPTEVLQTAPGSTTSGISSSVEKDVDTASEDLLNTDDASQSYTRKGESGINSDQPAGESAKPNSEEMPKRVLPTAPGSSTTAVSGSFAEHVDPTQSNTRKGESGTNSDQAPKTESAKSNDFVLSSKSKQTATEVLPTTPDSINTAVSSAIAKNVDPTSKALSNTDNATQSKTRKGESGTNSDQPAGESAKPNSEEMPKGVLLTAPGSSTTAVSDSFAEHVDPTRSNTRKSEFGINSHQAPETENPKLSRPDLISSSRSKETPKQTHSEQKSRLIPKSKVPEEIPKGSCSGHREEKKINYHHHRRSYERHEHKNYGDSRPHERYRVHKKSEQETFRVSKALATLLRHGYPKDIRLDECGYAKVNDILRHPFFRKFHTNHQEIKEIVEQNDKKRFQMSEDFQKIRAVQGHSVQFKETDIGMTPITDASQFKNVFHGTYEYNWSRIEKQGLMKMSRTHIHFAIGEIHDDHVISGMKRDSEVILKLDLARALHDGLKFFLSPNNVILTQGDDSGTVPPKYFRLYKRWNRRLGVYQPCDYRQGP